MHIFQIFDQSTLIKTVLAELDLEIPVIIESVLGQASTLTNSQIVERINGRLYTLILETVQTSLQEHDSNLDANTITK